MVTAIDRNPASSDGLAWATVKESPRIWGLGAREFHLGWWRSQGVHWVQRGGGDVPDRGADLFLLTEPDHLVFFELARLVPALTWNCPSVTRLRVVVSSGDDYREIVDRGVTGSVVGIRREYRSQRFGSRRVFLTADVSVARLWAQAADRRTVMMALRANGKWARSDHHRIDGEIFRLGEPSDEGRFISELIWRWQDVGRVVDGVEEVAPGVWGPRGLELHQDDIVVGPVWLGDRQSDQGGLRVIGPAWRADEAGGRAPVAQLRSTDDITPSTRRSNQATDWRPTTFDVGKRVFDLTVASVLLCMLAPVMLVIAIAVLFDDGWPAFFGHERQTRGGKTFSCLKFRTMRRNAERLASTYAEQNVCDGPQVFIEDDPRVTRLGRVLRRLHLDELPQLINVVLGDMSLVGPRPSPERENRMCPAWRDARLSVRPGITGLWQVRRTRSPGLDFQEWIRFDMEYVSARSWGLDLWILRRTLFDVVRRSSGGATSARSTDMEVPS